MAQIHLPCHRRCLRGLRCLRCLSAADPHQCGTARPLEHAPIPFSRPVVTLVCTYAVTEVASMCDLHPSGRRGCLLDSMSFEAPGATEASEASDR